LTPIYNYAIAKYNSGSRSYHSGELSVNKIVEESSDRLQALYVISAASIIPADVHPGNRFTEEQMDRREWAGTEHLQGVVRVRAPAENLRQGEN
jgi:hypothetical protein